MTLTKKLEDTLLDKINKWYEIRPTSSKTPEKEEEFAELSEEIFNFYPAYEKYFFGKADIREMINKATSKESLLI